MAGPMILGVLQARCSSSRLPGKVLADVHGRPMIVRQLERLARSSSIDRLVVATSADPSEDALATAMAEAGVEVRRGPLDDVLERFRLVVEEFDPAHVVRLTADCPLADHAVVDQIIDAHLAGGSDYTSNVLRPTFPDGLDAEVVTRDAFERLVASGPDAREREHVTLGIYGHPERFTLRNVEQAPDRSRLRWTVDVPDDLAFVREVYARLYDENPDFLQADILGLLEQHPELDRTDASVARNAGSR
jgi:spore coat polysaccharide biosynthesis protein SpsF